MSTNLSSSSQSEKTPSHEELIKFVESIQDELRASNINLDPEQALRSAKLRPKLIEYYWKSKQDQDAAQFAETEDAAEAFFEGKLGITPETKKLEAVTGWVRQFGHDQTDQLPQLRKGDGENFVCCGLPESVLCCGKQQKVGTFAFLGEDYYGLCPYAVGVYKAVTQEKEMRWNPRLQYMNWTKVHSILEEKKQIAPLVEWIESLAFDRLENVEDLPVTCKAEISGRYSCGVPNGFCCRHEQPAHSFQAHNGAVYGLCKKAHDLFYQCFDQTNILHVKPTSSLAEATRFAEAQVKMQPLAKWVDRFVAMETAETQEEPVFWTIPPDPETGKIAVDDHGRPILTCGLLKSLECCDHTQRAVGFPSIGGVVYGLCAQGIKAYFDGRLRHNNPQCLMYTKDREKAESIAQWWREHNNESESSENKPETDSQSRAARIAREKAAKERREARQAADDARRPKPNEGSGDIAQQSMNGRGKK